MNIAVINLKTLPETSSAQRFNVSRMHHGAGGEHLRALGNPWRPTQGPGSTLDRYRTWLDSSLQTNTAQYRALARICAAAEQGAVELACWCNDPSTCHASIVRERVLAHLQVRARDRELHGDLDHPALLSRFRASLGAEAAQCRLRSHITRGLTIEVRTDLPLPASFEGVPVRAFSPR
jgi:hypothetical protein